MRRSFLRFVAAALPLTLCAGAWAQEFPSRPIRLVVSFPPGSGLDFIARAIQPTMAEKLGQPIVVENKAGGSGVLAASVVANAPPDGYTIVMTVPASTTTARALLGDKLRYEPKDLVPIGLIGVTPLVLVASQAANIHDLQEFSSLAKKAEGGLSVASYGIGSPSHFGMEMLKSASGLPLMHVPYQGSSGVQTALLAGEVPAGFDSLTSALPMIKSGRMVPIAITSKHRSQEFPKLPTFAELGFPTVDVVGWAGLHAPKGTPKAVIQRINASLNEALKSPEVKARLASRIEIAGGSDQDFADFLADETNRLEKVVQESKAQFK